MAAPPPTSLRAGPSRASKATGSPINIGTIDTHQPGTDFTDGPNTIQAYFNCVNDNGGINGHPLKLFVELDQTQPAQITAAAHKLIQSDHVVAIDGVFDLLECTLDQAYWKQLGIYEMDAGIAPECWSTPNSAAVNMGPRYSSDGAVQYALDVGEAPRRSCSSSPTSRAPATSPPVRPRSRSPTGVPITVAHRERADQRRQLGRAQPGQLRRLQRLGDPQLHPARGAGHPAGRPEAGDRGPGQVVGLLDAVRHRLPGQGAGTEVEQEAVRQRRGGQRPTTTTARRSRTTRRSWPSTARTWPAGSARSASSATCWPSSWSRRWRRSRATTT